MSVSAPVRPMSLDDVLSTSSSTASGPQVWSALGSAGQIARVYRNGRPGDGVDANRLAAVLTAADHRFDVGTTLSVCVQLATALPLLALGGPVAQKYLARVLAGRSVVALGATDETAGSDLTALGTSLRETADGLVLDGTKKWITNAMHAEETLVLARTRPGRHFANFTWVLVPNGAPGVHVELADTDLFRGSGTGHLRFNGVRVAPERIVGRRALGMPTFARYITVERLAGALWGVAMCRRVLADTHRRLLARASGTGTLWHLAGVRQRVAECLVRARELQALTRELACRVTEEHDTVAAAVLKSAVARTLEHVLTECAQLQGADGFTTTGVQRLRSQAALFGIGGGATEVVLAAVGDSTEEILTELAETGRERP